MVWTTPGGKTYLFFDELMKQPSLLIGGGAESGKTTVLRTFLYNSLFRAPVEQADGEKLIIVDESLTGLMEFKDLPHTIKFASDQDEAMDAIQLAFDIANQRLEKTSLDRNVGCAEKGDIYLVIDNLHWILAEQRSKASDILLRLCLRLKQSHVHLIASSRMDVGKRIFPEELLACIPSRLALRCGSRKESQRIIDLDSAYGIAIGEGYYRGIGMELTHYTDIPMIPDDEILERVKWWTGQIPPKGFFARLFSRKKKTVQQSKPVSEMSGYEFEKYTAQKLREAGYTSVSVTQKSGDYGADVIARSPSGKKVCFQCKKYSRPVGVKAVQEVSAAKVYYNCDIAAVVSDSGFTEQARTLAASTGVVLMDIGSIRRL